MNSVLTGGSAGLFPMRGFSSQLRAETVALLRSPHQWETVGLRAVSEVERTITGALRDYPQHRLQEKNTFSLKQINITNRPLTLAQHAVELHGPLTCRSLYFLICSWDLQGAEG